MYLKCNITGYPIPKVNWLKDNEPLSDKIKEKNKLKSCQEFVQGFMYRITGPSHVGWLVLCHPSHAQQTGFYTCQAENRAGKSNATAFLNVLGKSNFNTERVSIECGKAKTKVITLANQKGRIQSSKPIKTRSNYT